MFKKIFYSILGIILTFRYKTGLAQYTIDKTHPEYKPENLPSSPYSYDPTSVSYLLGEFIVVLLQLSGGVAIFFIVLSGFKYVIAMGAQEKVDEAKKSLTWSVIGLFVIILSYAIVENLLKIFFAVPATAE